MPCRRPTPNRSPLSRFARLALAAGLGAALSTLAAPGVHAQSLQDALSKTLIDNPRLLSERARQDATKQGVVAAWAARLPSVWGTGDYALTNRSTTHPASPKAPENPYSYGVTVSTPLFNGFKGYNDIRGAKARSEAGASTLVDTEQTVLLNAAGAYLAVIRDRETVALRKRGADAMAGVLKSTRIRFGGGETTKTDISQAQARYQMAKAEMERAQGDLAASMADFEKLIGVRPDKLARPKLPEALLPKTANEAVAMSDHDNPKIMAALHNSDAARFAANSALGEFAPSVNLELSSMHYGQYDSVIDRKDDFSVKLALKVPILVPGLIPKVEEARAVARQRRYDAIDTRGGVAAAAVSAFEHYAAAKRRVGSIQAQVEAARAAAAGVRVESDAGQRTVVDILNAEEELVAAEVGRAAALYERDYYGFVLLATVGRMTGHEVIASQ